MFGDRTTYRYAALRDFRVRGRDEVEAWLTPGERMELRHWRDPVRCEAWLCGRWLAKLLASALCPGAAPAAIEISSRDHRDRSVCPSLRSQGATLPWSLSISHTRRGVLVGVCREVGTRIGLDLVDAAPVVPGFLETWLAPAEIVQARRLGAWGGAALWALKEAVYKAANSGEPFRPRHAEIHAVGLPRFEGLYRGSHAPAGCELYLAEVSDDHLAAIALARDPNLAAPTVGRVGIPRGRRSLQ